MYDYIISYIPTSAGFRRFSMCEPGDTPKINPKDAWFEMLGTSIASIDFSRTNFRTIIGLIIYILSNSIASMEEKFGAEIFFWPWFLWFSLRKGPWTPATSDKSWRSRMVMGAMLDTPWRVGYTGYTYLYTFYLECGTSKKTRKNEHVEKKHSVYIYSYI